MVKLILITTCFFCTAATFTGNIYSFSVTSIEGVSKPLTACQGKKIMVVSLPTQQNSTNNAMLYKLDSLGAAYTGTLQIIAVPAYENGYTAIRKMELQLWYRSILGQDIIVTEGMYIRKTSGNDQHPLFKWLTYSTENTHFNLDADGVGKFFMVGTTGTLYGVLPLEIPAATLNQVLQQNM